MIVYAWFTSETAGAVKNRAHAEHGSDKRGRYEGGPWQRRKNAGMLE